MLITRLKSVLIFAILAAVFSCADPYESSEVALENSRRAVQPEDIPHVTSKLFDRLGLANGTERFSMASATGDPEFTIDWEKILESIDSSGTATYTFYLHSNGTRPGEFYNLVMRLDSENNAYKPFIVRYTMTDEFLQQYLATGSMEGFDGEMSIIPVKGPDSGTEYQASLPDHVRSITPDKDCPEENIGFDGGSSGGGGGGPSTGGSTGGGGRWVTVTRCDYYLVKNYYETYVDGEYSSTNYYYTMEKDCYEYSYLSHTEVAGEDDCELGDGEIPIIIDEEGPDCESFNYINITSDGSWQEAAVKDFHFKIIVTSTTPGDPTLKTATFNFPQPILFGLPTFKGESNEISNGKAATLSAQLLLQAIDNIGERYARTTTSTSVIEAEFKRELQRLFGRWGGRVNFNYMGGSPAPITTYSTRLWGTGNCD